ncbi:MAG: hydantoinase/oxoprolinase family protein [Promethearchaeota archaeon]
MKESIILGLDIGGANTKAAVVSFQGSILVDSHSYIEYFPFWEKTIGEIPEMLQRVIKTLSASFKHDQKNIDLVCVSITAELSDAFQTKKEGVLTIINALELVFDEKKLRFISNKNKYLNVFEAKKSYYSIAASNWVSTALFLGQFEPQCILIDAGSTTVDIIPILDSVPVSKGKDDVSRMLNHELVYTGGLRATIPSITHFIPYKGKDVRISFEKFALIADIHRILGNISEKEYTIDTADNRSRSIEDCYARLARVICLDKDTISHDELREIASYIYSKQLNIVSSEIIAFLTELRDRIPEFRTEPKFVITGLSADFLIRKALETLDIGQVESYKSIVNIPNNITSSAFSVACAYYYTTRMVN